MSTHLHRADQFKSLLAETRTIAAVGVCCDPACAAYYVPEYLYHEGFRIVPVSTKHLGMRMWGEPVRTTLADIREPVDVVCIFRGAGLPHQLIDDVFAMKYRPSTVWFPPGTEHAQFGARLVAAGLDVVEDRCMAAEHKCAGLSVFG